ncbi:MAG: cytochrome b/b6 domain-containing protein [Nitrospirae bacterium]|nr:cytochrome b/b6 domain-containing protein [Nitrospirota bacterium]
MNDKINVTTDTSPDIWLRLTHLGILIFGIAAWISGYAAGDYKRIDHSGFDIHQWLGIGASFFVFIRIAIGLFGSEVARFRNWLPITGERISAALKDIQELVRFRMPHRPTHQGLAGVVQTFGLAVFVLLAISGGLLFLLLDPGMKARGIVHDIKEVHEIGGILIPAFLSLHGGAVIMHTFAGNHVWKRIFIHVEQQQNSTE